MTETDDKYWECPVCGWVISFTLKGDKYVSLCPYCQNRLEIDKEEFENNSDDSIERFFEFDY